MKKEYSVHSKDDLLMFAEAVFIYSENIVEISYEDEAVVVEFDILIGGSE